MDKLLNFITNPLFLVLIVFIVLLLAFNLLQKLSRGRAWKQIAAEMGLQFSKHQTATYRDQQMRGTYRNRQLIVIESESEEYHANRRWGDQRRRSREGSQINTDTEIRLRMNVSKGVKMSLVRIITIGKVTPVTGDEEVDRYFDITSEPDWLVKKVLTSANIRQKLLQIKMGGSLFVQDTGLIFTQVGRISDGKYLRFLLDLLCDIADVVESAAMEMA